MAAWTARQVLHPRAWGGSSRRWDGSGLAEDCAKGANKIVNQEPAIREHRCGASLFGVGHLQKSGVRNLRVLPKSAVVLVLAERWLDAGTRAMLSPKQRASS